MSGNRSASGIHRDVRAVMLAVWLGAFVMATAACSRPVSDEPGPTPDGPRLFVSNEVSGDLSVIDPETHAVMSTVPVGRRPRGLAMSPDGRLLYVALSGAAVAGPPGAPPVALPPPDPDADGIAVVDIDSLRVVRVLAGGSNPQRPLLSADGSRLYLPNEADSTVEVWDAVTGDVLTRIPVGREPEGIAMSPDGRFVYVTSENDNDVHVIETVSDAAVARFEVGARPRGVAFGPDGARAWVTGENDATVSVVDVLRHEVIHTITIPDDGARPMGVVVSPDGSEVYVATGRGGTVVFIEADTHAIAGSVAVGDRPWNLALSPDGRFLYTANGPSDDVTVVNVGERRAMTTIRVGGRPWGVLWGP